MIEEERSRREVLIGAASLTGLVGLSRRLELPELLVPPSLRRPGPGEVALTFDDGPHRTITDYTRKILDRKGVRASFFVLGVCAKSYPNVVRRLAWDGHKVQNHSWDHHRLDTLSWEGIENELSRCSSLVKSLTGSRPTAFRPPYGYTNSRVRDVGASLGMGQVLWNATTPLRISSWVVGMNEIKHNVAIAKSQKKGVTVLLHDGSGTQLQMLDLLPRLIDWFRAQGWRFVTIR